MMSVIATYPFVVVPDLVDPIVGEVSPREKVIQAVTKILISSVRVIKG